jgi:hypothetical protein
MAQSAVFFGSESECFQSALHVAILNAINNAVGVSITELPASPEKVKAGIEAKARGEQMKTPKYYLGPDFYEDIDEMARQVKQIEKIGSQRCRDHVLANFHVDRMVQDYLGMYKKVLTLRERAVV